jgi:ribosomal protein L16 Arg81 hydroxylase
MMNREHVHFRKCWTILSPRYDTVSFQEARRFVHSFAAITKIEIMVVILAFSTTGSGTAGVTGVPSKILQKCV